MKKQLATFEQLQALIKAEEIDKSSTHPKGNDVVLIDQDITGRWAVCAVGPKHHLIKYL